MSPDLPSVVFRHPAFVTQHIRHLRSAFKFLNLSMSVIYVCYAMSAQDKAENFPHKKGIQH